MLINFLPCWKTFVSLHTNQTKVVMESNSVNMIKTSGRYRTAVFVKAERVGDSFPWMLCPVLVPSSPFFETVKFTLYGRNLTLSQ